MTIASELSRAASFSDGYDVHVETRACTSEKYIEDEGYVDIDGIDYGFEPPMDVRSLLEYIEDHDELVAFECTIGDDGRLNVFVPNADRHGELFTDDD